MKTAVGGFRNRVYRWHAAPLYTGVYLFALPNLIFFFVSSPKRDFLSTKTTGIVGRFRGLCGWGSDEDILKMGCENVKLFLREPYVSKPGMTQDKLKFQRNPYLPQHCIRVCYPLLSGSFFKYLFWQIWHKALIWYSSLEDSSLNPFAFLPQRKQDWLAFAKAYFVV